MFRQYVQNIIFKDLVTLPPSGYDIEPLSICLCLPAFDQCLMGRL